MWHVHVIVCLEDYAHAHGHYELQQWQCDMLMLLAHCANCNRKTLEQVEPKSANTVERMMTPLLLFSLARDGTSILCWEIVGDRRVCDAWKLQAARKLPPRAVEHGKYLFNYKIVFKINVFNKSRILSMSTETTAKSTDTTAKSYGARDVII